MQFSRVITADHILLLFFCSFGHLYLTHTAVFFTTEFVFTPLDPMTYKGILHFYHNISDAKAQNLSPVFLRLCNARPSSAQAQ